MLGYSFLFSYPRSFRHVSCANVVAFSPEAWRWRVGRIWRVQKVRVAEGIFKGDRSLAIRESVASI